MCVSVFLCKCVCVWLIGGSIWGSISHSNCLAKWCNCALSHHKLCLTPCATPNPLPTLHIIQLNKFPFSLTVLPACIPLFILLNFCHLLFFPALSLADLHEWLQRVEQRLFDGHLGRRGRFSPGSIPRPGMPSRRKRPWQHKQPKQWLQLQFTRVHWCYWFGKRP